MSNLRTEMPGTTAFIDSLRDAFGKDGVDGLLVRAVHKGEPTFWSSEKGRAVGARAGHGRTWVAWDRRGMAYSFEVPPRATFEEQTNIAARALQQANARVFNRAGCLPDKLGSGND